jgi:hypothetical protein
MLHEKETDAIHAAFNPRETLNSLSPCKRTKEEARQDAVEALAKALAVEFGAPDAPLSTRRVTRRGATPREWADPRIESFAGFGSFGLLFNLNAKL